MVFTFVFFVDGKNPKKPYTYATDSHNLCCQKIFNEKSFFNQKWFSFPQVFVARVFILDLQLIDFTPPSQ